MKSIYNPYTANVPVDAKQELLDKLQVQSFAFNRGVFAALEACKPRKFADEVPNEGQEVICFSPNHNVNSFTYTKKRFTETLYFDRYTHWIPYPKLD